MRNSNLSKQEPISENDESPFSKELESPQDPITNFYKEIDNNIEPGSN